MVLLSRYQRDPAQSALLEDAKYVSLFKLLVLSLLSLFSEYSGSLHTYDNIRDMLERSFLKYMFLTIPGQVISDSESVCALEKICGCFAHDNGLNLGPLFEVVSRLLYLARIPDINVDFSLHYYGINTVPQFLGDLGIDVRHAFVTTTRSDFSHRYVTSSTLFEIPVSKGYGSSEELSIVDNSRSLRSSDILQRYCDDFRTASASVSFVLIHSERIMYQYFDIETFLIGRYSFTYDDLALGTEYHRLYRFEQSTARGIPIRFPVVLCMLILDGAVKSAAVHINASRARILVYRRLVCSLRENLSMEDIFRQDTALNQPAVMALMAKYFPFIPYPLEVIRPHLQPAPVTSLALYQVPAEHEEAPSLVPTECS